MRRGIVCLAVACLILSLSSLLNSAWAAGPAPQREKFPLKRAIDAPLTPQRLLETTDKLAPDAKGRVHVIVELEALPVAQAIGVKSAQPALRPGTGKLDLNSAVAKSYSTRLDKAHAQFKSSLALLIPRAKLKYAYQIVLNGFALSMPAEDVARLYDLPGVRRVHADTLMRVHMDASLPLIGAPQAWQSLGGVAHAGEGIKVAVIDTGIRPENPLFNGDGFTYPPDDGPWPKGECVTQPHFCTGKIIATRYYAPFPVPADEVLSPLDVDGHGSHTAGAAVGNAGVMATVGGVTATISGVAPRAWLMVYKGLFADGQGGAFGSVSNLALALEDTVRDGADVINNSWGGGPGDPTDNPAAIAAENAVAAGVVVVFSAGNLGPTAQSIGVPGNTPGVITVGSTTTTRDLVADVRLASQDGHLLQVTGASVGTGASGPFVMAEGVPDSAGNRSGLALNPYPDGTFAGKVVLVRRGTNARAAKSHNVAAGGAVGMVMYNAVATEGVVADPHVIPTVHISLTAGLALRDYLIAHPTTSVTLTPVRAAPIRPDVLAEFSSRGPNGNAEFIKPDLVAPGVNILSAYSPDNPLDGVPFAALSGTSMSAPHVTGAAALVRQRHPTLTPSQIKSALMTTANLDEIRLEDGQRAATVHERGAGRLNVAHAIDPGLVFDTPSLGVPAIIGRAQRVVRATNVAVTPATYTTSAVAPTRGTQLTVSPAEFTLAPGETANLTVTIDLVGADVGAYTAGQINFTEVNGTHHAHIVTWLQAAPTQLPDRLGLTARSDSGDQTFSLTTNFDAPSLSVLPYGLAAPDKRRLSITEDPDHLPETNPLDPAQGWRVITYTVEADTKFLVAQTSHGTSRLEDVDLYILRDANGDGRFDIRSELIQSSRGVNVEEEIRIEDPAPGLFAVATHGFKGQGDFDLRVWRVVVDAGNFGVTSPNGPVIAGTPYTARLRWQGTSEIGEPYYGLVRLMGPHGEVGAIPVTITRLPDTELLLQAAPSTVAAGRPVTYTYTVTNFEEQPVEFTLTDQLPPNLRVDLTSLHDLTYDADHSTLQTSFTLRAARSEIDFLSSDNGPLIAPRYIDLPVEVGTQPLPQGTNGDDVGVDFQIPDELPPLSYLGKSYRTVGVVSNGYVVPGGLPGFLDILYEPLRLPNPTRPNPMIAPFWADLDLAAGVAGHGEWYADVVSGGPFGDRHALIVQWREAAQFGIPSARNSFEVIIMLETGEVYFVYAAMAGSDVISSVGLEDDAGMQGKSWYFRGEPASHRPHSDLTLVLDINPDAVRFTQQVITYHARPMAAGLFTNQVALTRTDNTTRSLGAVSVTATRPEPRTLTVPATPDRTGYARPLLPRLPVFGEGVLAGYDPMQRLTYSGMLQFAALGLRPGTEITQATVNVWGLDNRFLDPLAEGRWWLDLLDESVNADYSTLLAPVFGQAPKDATLTPTLTQTDIGPGRMNSFRIAPSDLVAFSARSAMEPLSFRLNGESLNNRRAIFTWDSGHAEHPPLLHLEYLPPVVELP